MQAYFTKAHASLTVLNLLLKRTDVVRVLYENLRDSYSLTHETSGMVCLAHDCCFDICLSFLGLQSYWLYVF